VCSVCVGWPARYGGRVDPVGSPRRRRRYDAEHLAQHPLQKVTVIKLLITAENVADDKFLQYIHSGSASIIAIAPATSIPAANAATRRP
jgi:hypothetical protein